MQLERSPAHAIRSACRSCCSGSRTGKPLKEVYAAALSLLRDVRLRLVPPATAALLSTAAFEVPPGLLRACTAR
jgi:hypothetical protein